MIIGKLKGIGNVTFETQELMDSAKMDEGTVTGEVTVAE